MKQGVWYGLGAYISWGLLPAYWKTLAEVPSTQLIGHRIVWCCLLILIVLRLQRRAGPRPKLQARVLLRYSLAAALIGVNWLTYVWAVNAGFIVETSLGYFINPLFSVLLGVVVLRERLRPLQLLSIALATAGVVYLGLAHGSVPWIALILATTFALYGLVKKTSPLGSLDGMALEMAVLLLPALAYLVYAGASGEGAFLRRGAGTDLLLIASGPVTLLPLLMFASAAKRIPLSWIGLLQYIAPSMQFLLGVLVYHEPLSSARLLGFCIVWAALALFAAEGLLASRKAPGRPAERPK